MELLHVSMEIYIWKFIDSLLTVIKNWNQPKYSTEEEMGLSIEVYP